jgi:hypothetical protein
MQLTAAGRELHASCAEVFLIFGALDARLGAHRDKIPGNGEEGDASRQHPTRLQRG